MEFTPVPFLSGRNFSHEVEDLDIFKCGGFTTGLCQNELTLGVANHEALAIFGIGGVNG